MKTCEDYKKLASEYIDGELNDNETSQLFYHMGECNECRAFMSSLMKLHSAFQESSLPSGRIRPRTSLWTRTLSISYPLAAVITLVVMLSGFLLVQRAVKQPTVIEKTNTEYVYISSLPAVYAKLTNGSDTKSN